jgi:pectinesterase
LYRDYVAEGDVDFIFVRATAVFSGCTIHAPAERIGSNSSCITAASTDTTTLGYHFENTSFTAGSADARFYLGRPWNSAVPGTEVNALVTIRESVLGGHVEAGGWADWPGQGGVDLLAADMRSFEHANSGEGAVSTTSGARRVLSDEEATAYTIASYLDDEGDRDGYDTARPGSWSE